MAYYKRGSRRDADSAHDTITATALVRNLSVAIDKVIITRHRFFYITKGSQSVAELSPSPKPGLPINQLAKLLRSLPKPGNDATAIAKENALSN